MKKLEFLSSPPSLDSYDDLLQLNKEGFIAGPEEEKQAFFLRVDQTLAKAPTHPTPFPPDLQKQYEINPTFLEVSYSNESLDAWEAGCTWIMDNRVTIQLRKQFKKASFWFGFFSKEEVLSHEAIHAVRMKFYEPMFEEVLAYSTSKHCWRRFLGPLFRSTGETHFFLFFVLFGAFLFPWFPWIGFFCIFCPNVFFLFRLFRTQSLFHKAKKKIRKLLGIEPLWVLLRLTDKEIRLFATQPTAVLEDFARKEKLKSVRWRQIYQSYFT